MTRLDADVDPHDALPPCDGPRAELYEARQVPLGGLRGMDVRRALPQRPLPTVGAWCFVDRFGPQEVVMRVDPHPHTGLQTVTWPFVGDVHHRDILGNDVVVRRGELNIMTSGNGIAHSEYSLGADPVALDALQFWIALPESRRHGEPDFEHIASPPTVALPAMSGSDATTTTATVIVGSLGGVTSPARVYTPLVGAEVPVPADHTVHIPLDPAWEHAIVGAFGSVTVHAEPTTTVKPTDLLFIGKHRESIAVSATSDAVIFLMGGEPFAEDLVMWWNFVGRTHEEIVAAQQDWAAHAPRFGGRIVGHGEERIPAPPMPNVRLTPRLRRR